MVDLISRQAAIRWVKTECNPYGKPTLEFESGKKVIEHLEQMPSAERVGCWNTIQGDIVVCSECGMGAPQVMTGCLVNRHLEPNRTNYCPNCGADMRGDSDEHIN